MLLKVRPLTHETLVGWTQRHQAIERVAHVQLESRTSDARYGAREKRRQELLAACNLTICERVRYISVTRK